MGGRSTTRTAMLGVCDAGHCGRLRLAAGAGSIYLFPSGLTKMALKLNKEVLSVARTVSHLERDGLVAKGLNESALRCAALPLKQEVNKNIRQPRVAHHAEASPIPGLSIHVTGFVPIEPVTSHVM